MHLVLEDGYDTKYDDIDVNGILENNKLREQYYKCFMDQAPCMTADSKFFKEIVGEAYHTNCKKCNERQNIMLDTMVKWYKQNQPDKFKAFEEKTGREFQKKA
ncbi:ejaculatory bulb-specific protein 3 [Linepithema humile]|uniref:ejaculatory bulb-specific protein 3 n=1 Tax=Linepithema humile TaxID=83485 RepID=UPI00351DEE33